MTANTRNDVARLQRCATALGVKLPKPVQSILDFQPSAQPTVAEVQADVELSVSMTIGDSKAFDAAVTDGLARIAAARAADGLRGRIADLVDQRRFDVIGDNIGDIRTAFAGVLGDDVATVNANAASVPVTARTADGLAPEIYRAHFEAGQAMARLQAYSAAMAPWHQVGIPRVPAAVAQRLLLVTELPSPANAPERAALGKALAGVRQYMIAGGLWAGDADGAAWYVLLSLLGVRFGLADAEQLGRSREAFGSWITTDANAEPTAATRGAIL